VKRTKKAKEEILSTSMTKNDYEIKLSRADSWHNCDEAFKKSKAIK